MEIPERLEKFINREAADNRERLVKEFLGDWVISPIYSLKEDGSLDGRVFLYTDLSEKDVRDTLKKVLPGINIKLTKDIFCTSYSKNEGFWADVAE